MSGVSIVTWRQAAWCWAALLCIACDAAPEAPVLDLPPRPPGAPGGAEIYEALRDLDLQAREELVYREVARGNVPGWLRRLRPVETRAEIDGQTRTLTFWVTPDYLAVGSDDDHFYIPVSGRTAQRIGELTGTSLPTPGMVDAIWAAAWVRLIPIRIPPDEHMTTVRVFRRHDRLVQAQRRQHGGRAGDFLAGHKLDVVLLSAAAPDHVQFGVYGWHHRDGTPVQPPHPLGDETPPHFSMGLRLVHNRVLVDGGDADLGDVVVDAPWAGVSGLVRLISPDRLRAVARFRPLLRVPC